MSIKLAGCVIKDERERILLLHRNTPELVQWEIPGGKIEDGEEASSAAAREIKEELGVEVEAERHLGEKEFTQSGRDWLYVWYLARITLGTPTIMEPEKFDDFRYFSINELDLLYNSLSPNTRNFHGMFSAGEITLK